MTAVRWGLEFQSEIHQHVLRFVPGVMHTFTSVYTWVYTFRNDGMTTTFGADNVWEFTLNAPNQSFSNIFFAAQQWLKRQYTPADAARKRAEELSEFYTRVQTAHTAQVAALRNEIVSLQAAVRDLRGEVNVLLTRDRGTGALPYPTIQAAARSALPGTPAATHAAATHRADLATIVSAGDKWPDIHAEAHEGELGAPATKRRLSATFINAADYDVDNFYNSDDDEETRARKFRALDDAEHPGDDA